MKPEDFPGIDPKLLADPTFQRVVAEGLAIQHRFSAEPVYARTGKGYLKSEGVEELQRIKEASRINTGQILPKPESLENGD